MPDRDVLSSQDISHITDLSRYLVDGKEWPKSNGTTTVSGLIG
jgi:hypothetical protein